MIPLVLGGIALAVVGYGLKEYCEDERCPWDEKTSNTSYKPINTFDLLHEKKVSLYSNSLTKLKEQLLKIEDNNKKFKFKSKVAIHKELLIQSDLEDDVKVYATTYKKLLDKLLQLVHILTNKMEMLLSRSTSYNDYTNLEKKSIGGSIQVS